MRDLSITAAERAALHEALCIDDARINQAVRWANHAGYERDELAGVILDAAHAPPPETRPGRNPMDALRAAIFAHSPLHEEREIDALQGVLTAQGVLQETWPDFAAREKPRSVREIALQCAADLLRHNYPGNTRRGRRRRVKARSARDAGQRGFSGGGWGFENAGGVQA